MNANDYNNKTVFVNHYSEQRVGIVHFVKGNHAYVGIFGNTPYMISNQAIRFNMWICLDDLRLTEAYPVYGCESREDYIKRITGILRQQYNVRGHNGKRAQQHYVKAFYGSPRSIGLSPDEWTRCIAGYQSITHLYVTGRLNNNERLFYERIDAYQACEIIARLSAYGITACGNLHGVSRQIAKEGSMA